MEDSDLEIVENYLFGRLSSPEKQEVEERLHNEPELAAALEKMKVLANTAQKYELRQKIKELQIKKASAFETTTFEVSSQKSNFKAVIKWTSLVAAACLAGVLYLGTADFSIPNTLSLQERSAGEDISKADKVDFQTIINAQKELEKKNYVVSAKMFAQIKNTASFRTYYRDMSKWFEVVALSEIDEKQAKVLFEEIKNTPDFKYKISKTDWVKMQIRLVF